MWPLLVLSIVALTVVLERLVFIARAAGEGVVILRLTVDGSGRPIAVSVAKSSGYRRLDRAATEAGWRCRVRDAAPGSHLDAPVRFNLRD